MNSIISNFRANVAPVRRELTMLATTALLSLMLTFWLLSAMHLAYIAGMAVAGLLLLGLWLVSRPWRSGMWLTLGLFLVFFVFAEGYFRVKYFGFDAITHPLRHRPAGMDDPLSGVLYSSETVTGLAANQKRWFKGQPFVTNSLGFRDHERSITKPPETFRIAVLGDSVDMGSGVTQREYYSQQIEQALNASTTQGVAYEVLNFAKGGYNIENTVELLEKAANQFQPDLYIIGYYSTFDDYTGPIQAKQPTTVNSPWYIKLAYLLKYPGRLSYFYMVLDNEILENILREYSRKSNPSQTATSNDKSKRNINEGFYELELLQQYDSYYRKRLLELTEGKPVILFLDRHLPTDIEYTIYPGDGHPNPKAHLRYAKRLMDFMFAENLLPKQPE